MLEAAKGVKLEVEKEGGKGGGEWFGGTRPWTVGRRENEDKENIDPRRRKGDEAEKDDSTQDEGKKSQEWHVSNFWTAYDALAE